MELTERTEEKNKINGVYFIQKIHKYKLEISVVLGLIIAILFGSVYEFTQECNAIRDETFRLHIKANSDEREDQELKLKVRDTVLEVSKELFKGVEEKDMAKSISKEALVKLEESAKEVVIQEGYNYPVTAKVDKLYFDTRYYDTFTLPAGEYDALSMDIGKGEGKNWWCVLFPPLCLPAVTQAEQIEEMDGLYTEEGQDIMVNGEAYEVRFALVEMIEKGKAWLKSLWNKGE